MEELFSSNVPDTPTPANSAGYPSQGYGNAAGEFNIQKKLNRKVKSRKNLDQPTGEVKTLQTYSDQDDSSMKRYYGDFSVEAKRNVRDLLENHPQYDKRGNVKMGRVQNNTRDKNIMPNDPTKTVVNGGHVVYEDQPKASQTKYPNGTQNN